jgi:hypothetical protein
VRHRPGFGVGPATMVAARRGADGSRAFCD